MNNCADGADTEQVEKAEETPASLRATVQDLAVVEIEAPITGAITADCGKLSDLYRAAANTGGGSAEPTDTPAARVFLMLSALAGMHFKPSERNEPFGPMMVLADDGAPPSLPTSDRTLICSLRWPSAPAILPFGRGSLTCAGCSIECEQIWGYQ